MYTAQLMDINFSLTALLTLGTLYLQQSFLAPVRLFLNEINQSIKLLLQAAWPIKTHTQKNKEERHTHTRTTTNY